MSTDSFPLGAKSVHRIGFGAMQLAGPGVFGPPKDPDAAVAVLRAAVEHGVDHIDTAQYYGPDVVNDLIREALHPYPADLALVSKVGAVRDGKGRWLPALAPEQLRQGVLDNLASLRVDRLDAVNLRLTDEDKDFDEQLDAMIAIRDEGLIAGIGLSNVTRDGLVHAVQRTEITCVQNPLNLAERDSLPVLRECEQLGVAFVPFFPLGSAFGGGSNKILTHPDVVAISTRLGATPAQVALAWLLDLAPNVLLIPGTSSPSHLRENLEAADVRLDDDARTTLEAFTV